MLYNVVSVDTDKVVVIAKRNYLPVKYKSGVNDCEYNCILDMGFSPDFSIDRVQDLMNKHLFMANVCPREVTFVDARLGGISDLDTWDIRHSIVSITEKFLRMVLYRHLWNRKVAESIFKVSMEFSKYLCPVGYKIYDLAGKGQEDSIGSARCNRIECDTSVVPVCPELSEWTEEFVRYGFLPSSAIDFYMAGGFLVKVELH